MASAGLRRPTKGRIVRGGGGSALLAAEEDAFLGESRRRKREGKRGGLGEAATAALG